MILTGSETTLLSEAKNQMAIPNTMVVQLVNEVISEVNDLLYFDKDNLQYITDNLFRPGVRVPRPNYIDPVPFLVPPPPVPIIPTLQFIFGAKYQKGLLIACDLI